MRLVRMFGIGPLFLFEKYAHSARRGKVLAADTMGVLFSLEDWAQTAHG